MGTRPDIPPPVTAAPEASAQGDGVALFRYALFTRTPRVWVTPAVVVLNVLVFVAMVAKGVSVMNPSIDHLLHWGANYAPRTAAGQWWRLLTNTFVHVGLIHIAMNMIGLWQIGGLVERLLGHRAFLLVYLVSGVCGSLASMWWNPHVVSAGASGAVFGIFGVLGAYLIRHRQSFPAPIRSQLQNNVLFFVGLNVVFGLQQTRIDMAAHLGGLVAGFLATLLVSRPLLTEPSRASLWREIAVAVMTAALVAAAVLFFPRPADVHAEMGRFQDVERQAIDTYNRALERRQSNEISDQQLVRILDTEVLPPWDDYRERLRALKHVPAEYAKRMENLELYMDLRGRGWSALSQALRTNDDAKAEEARQLQRQAEAQLKAEQAAAPPPAPGGEN